MCNQTYTNRQIPCSQFDASRDSWLWEVDLLFFPLNFHKTGHFVCGNWKTRHAHMQSSVCVLKWHTCACFCYNAHPADCARKQPAKNEKNGFFWNNMFNTGGTGVVVSMSPPLWRVLNMAKQLPLPLKVQSGSNSGWPTSEMLSQPMDECFYIQALTKLNIACLQWSCENWYFQVDKPLCCAAHPLLSSLPLVCMQKHVSICLYMYRAGAIPSNWPPYVDFVIPVSSKLQNMVSLA